MTNIAADMRYKARDCLERAKTLLANGGEDALRYASIELRFCIEYLLLDRLNSYREYLDDEAMSRWTPSKIVREMLNIDPDADKTAQISIGIEETYGVPAKEMHWLGEDRRLKLKWASESWNALGNFLHAPSLQQLQDQKVVSEQTKRNKAQEIADHLTHVLAAHVWNVVGRPTYEYTCTECDTHTRRMISGVELAGGFTCRNPQCQTVYDVKEEPEHNRVLFGIRRVGAECFDCNHQTPIKVNLAVAGKSYVCEKCGAHWRFKETLTLEKIGATGPTEVAKPLDTST